jgi:hypothetical protein
MSTVRRAIEGATGDLSHFFTVQTLADYVAQRVRELLGEQAWA